MQLDDFNKFVNYDFFKLDDVIFFNKIEPKIRRFHNVLIKYSICLGNSFTVITWKLLSV
jgi:hypothetical protein